MNRIKWVAILSVISVSLSGCYFLPEEEETLSIPELVKPQEEQYVTVKVEKNDISEKIECNANFVPSYTEEFSFTKGDRMKKVYVKNWDTVKKGDLLAEQETYDLEYSIKTAKIDLEKKKINIERIKAENHKKKVDSEKAKEKKQLEWTARQKEIEKNIEKLDKNYKKLEEDYISTQKLLEVGGVAPNQLKDIESKMDECKLDRQGHEEKLDLLKKEIQEDAQITQLEDVDYGLKTEELSYQMAEMDIKKKENQLALARIYAPMDGLIYFAADFKPGQYIDAYKNVVSIASMDDFVMQYTGDVASKYTQGQKVSIKYKDKEYEGEVTMTPLTIPEEHAKKYGNTVQFKFSNSEDKVDVKSTKEYATVTLMKQEKKDVLCIPSTALKSNSAGYYVYVLENGIRVEKGIEIGIKNSALTEVVSGLKEGELVILK